MLSTSKVIHDIDYANPDDVFVFIAMHGAVKDLVNEYKFIPTHHGHVNGDKRRGSINEFRIGWMKIPGELASVVVMQFPKSCLRVLNHTKMKKEIRLAITYVVTNLISHNKDKDNILSNCEHVEYIVYKKLGDMHIGGH